MDRRSGGLLEETKARVEAIAAEWRSKEGVFLEHGENGSEEFKEEEFRTATLHPSSPEQPACVWKCLVLWGRSFQLLLWRTMVDSSRNFGSNLIRFGTMLLVTVLLSLVFQHLSRTQNGIQDRVGLLFFITINQVYQATN